MAAVYTVISKSNYNSIQTWTASGPTTKDSGVTLYNLAIVPPT